MKKKVILMLACTLLLSSCVYWGMYHFSDNDRVWLSPYDEGDTLWWQPDITTDEQGKAKVEFFNNSTCEEMYISVEGMTSDGKILVNE